VDTDSVLDAISTSNLGDLVSHRHLILPQLAASSVSKAVLADNGWIAVFGPVEIDDVGEFIKNENRKSPEQSIATFGLHRRMEYNLAHLVFETTMFMIMTPVFLALSLLGGVMLSWHIYWMTNLFLIIVGAWILGTFMALVDPIMPTSSGYVRGAITGVFALIIWKMALLYLSPFSPLAVIYEWAWLDASGLTILGLALFVGFNGTIVVLFAIGFYFPLGIF
jgi:hypothetical protein